MPRPVNWNDVPDSMTLDDGFYLFQIENIEETFQEETGILGYQVHLCVVEPAAFVGRYIRPRFKIGTEDDPNADDPALWHTSRPAIRLKQLLKKAGVPLSNDLDQDRAAAVGKLVGGIVTKTVDNREGSDYYGQEQNWINQYFAPGEREISVAALNQVGGRPAGPGRPTSAARPASAPAAGARRAPAARPTPAPTQAARPAPAPAAARKPMAPTRRVPRQPTAPPPAPVQAELPPEMPAAAPAAPAPASTRPTRGRKPAAPKPVIPAEPEVVVCEVCLEAGIAQADCTYYKQDYPTHFEDEHAEG